MIPTPGPATVQPVVTWIGNTKPTLRNAKDAIAALGVIIRRDEFRDQILVGGQGLPRNYHGAVSDRTLTWLRNRVLSSLHFDPGDEHIFSAVKGLAEEGCYNPILEWLNSKKWDGVKRLGDWLPRITGAAATPLTRRAGSLLLLGMVARARYPGTKFDICVVLEGPQGSGKSSLAKFLAGDEFFTDAPGLLGMDAKSRGELVAGRWVVELGELSGLSRTEVENVKAAISQTHDHYRAPYERVATKRPRTFVFVGTTNAQVYLMDTTGSRRFVPILCSRKIDLGQFASEREQLFAEADWILSQLVANRGAIEGQPLPSAFSLTLPPNLWPSAAAEAEDRRIVDHGEDLLVSILDNALSDPACKRQPSGAHFVTSVEIQQALRGQLGINPNNKVVANWMAKLGWTRTRHGKPQVRGFEKS